MGFRDAAGDGPQSVGWNSCGRCGQDHRPAISRGRNGFGRLGGEGLSGVCAIETPSRRHRSGRYIRDLPCGIFDHERARLLDQGARRFRGTLWWVLDRRPCSCSWRRRLAKLLAKSTNSGFFTDPRRQWRCMPAAARLVLCISPMAGSPTSIRLQLLSNRVTAPHLGMAPPPIRRCRTNHRWGTRGRTNF
jgi:hypothetical protein